MPSSHLLRVEGADRLRQLSKELRGHADGKEIRRDTVRELKRAADEIVQAERAAVRALPSKGESIRRGRRPLRHKIASATVSRVRTGAKDPEVSVLINASRLGDQAVLPAYMNAEQGSPEWEHPTFGHAPYVRQAATPWWSQTAEPFEGRVQQRLIGVLDRAADRIERGT